MKLIQAAALAAALVPLGSVAMEGASITCGFSGASSSGGCIQEGNQQTYNFNQDPLSAEDDYKVILEFFGMTNPFQLTVTDYKISHAAFQLREGLPGAYDCVDFVDPNSFANPCREFEFDPPDGNWSSFDFEFVWLYDSENNGYSNGSDSLGRIRILQNKDGPPTDVGGVAVGGGNFGVDMCLEALTNGAFDPCVYLASADDPRIGGGNTDFSTALVGSTVPEPSSLLLLTTGVSAVLYRRRRRGLPV